MKAVTTTCCRLLLFTAVACGGTSDFVFHEGPSDAAPATSGRPGRGGTGGADAGGAAGETGTTHAAGSAGEGSEKPPTPQGGAAGSGGAQQQQGGAAGAVIEPPPIDACPVNNCQNAGQCYQVGTSQGCECPPGFYGSNCSKTVKDAAFSTYMRCLLFSDGSIECTGSKRLAFPGPYSAISTDQYNSVCALRADGSVECVRDEAVPGLRVPAKGAFKAISGGFDNGCGLRANGSVECWSVRGTPLVPPSGEFAMISVNAFDACGVRTSGDLECWPERAGDLPKPTGKFKAVAVSSFRTACALRQEGSVACWGAVLPIDPNFQSWVESAGNFSELAFGFSQLCGRRDDGTVKCSRFTAPSGKFSKVWTAPDEACGLNQAGLLECWPRGAAAPPVDKKFKAIASSSGYTCGLLVDGRADCFSDEGTVVRHPAGMFTAIAAGEQITCGLRESGAAECWARLDAMPQPSSDAGPFTALAVGRFPCGLRSDGSVKCWGFGAGASLPAGPFTALAAQEEQVCGLRQDGSIECWGREVSGRFAAPTSGEYTVLSAHARATCAVSRNENVVCWGEGKPPNVYAAKGVIAYSTGVNYACAIRSDKTLKCWSIFGVSDNGRASPPPGMFTALSAARQHTCGIRVSGKVSCWGRGRWPRE